MISFFHQWNRNVATAELAGTVHKYVFYWREPMNHWKDLIMDPSLAPVSNWHAVRKYLVNSLTGEVQIYDEPHTSDDWYTYEVGCSTH